MRTLTKSNPEQAKQLIEQAEWDVRDRWLTIQQMAAMRDDRIDALATPAEKKE
jgi:ABC-type transport system substrate-binding protein